MSLVRKGSAENVSPAARAASYFLPESTSGCASSSCNARSPQNPSNDVIPAIITSTMTSASWMD